MSKRPWTEHILEIDRVPTIRLDLSPGAKARGLAALRDGRSLFLEFEREVRGTPIDDRADAVTYAVTVPQQPAPSLRERYCTGTCAMLNDAPHLHDSDCPVAPVPGLHGGMRESPVPAGPLASWEPRPKTTEWYGHRYPSKQIGPVVIHPARLRRYPQGSPLRDIVLMAFYLPPVQPDAAPARLPVDSDPDLEKVADVASRHPEGWL